MALESVPGGVKTGQEVELISGDLRLGDRALHVLGAGSTVAAQRLSLEAAASAEDAATEDAELFDVRVLTPVTRNAQNRRCLAFPRAIERQSPE